MLFGNPADFAIEADVEPNLSPPSPVLGHLRVWCRQTPLGNVDEAPCSLQPAFVGFQWLLSSLDSLWADEFLGLDDMAAWKFLDAVLYGFDGATPIEDRRTPQQIQSDWLAWRRFNFLTNWGEPFRDWKAFLLCPPLDDARVLYSRLPENDGHALRVTRKGIQGAAEAFVRWFGEQEARLGARHVT